MATVTIGEPIVCGEYAEEIMAPGGQYQLCADIWDEIPDLPYWSTVRDGLADEYMAIVDSLLTMDCQITVVKAHPEDLDIELMEYLEARGQSNFQTFPEFLPRELTMFPRDLCIEIKKGLTLVHMAVELSGEDKSLVSSPYGEGGRTLVTDKTILVCDDLPRSLKMPPAIRYLRNRGFDVGIVPHPMSRIGDVTMTGGHLDRVCCLIRGKDGSPYLVMDPKYQACISSEKDPKKFEAYTNHWSLEYLERLCDRMEINLRLPKRMDVPGSLCLLQLADGRVLMTSGDEPVAEVIADIVGEENLFFTPIPIRFYPAMTNAGIRCLVIEDL